MERIQNIKTRGRKVWIELENGEYFIVKASDMSDFPLMENRELDMEQLIQIIQ